ncbi:MAG TPA: SGNH/GDSL hydrolase family protein [Pyrinomonadaceae bacterium]
MSSKSFAYVTKVRVVALAALLLVFSQGTLGQSPAPAESPRDFNMLVLGDSILWGQGLKEQNKSWYLVKSWLQTNGHRVRERIEAHAGAMIGTPGAEMPKSLTVHSEIASAYPTLHDQIDIAVRSFVDPSHVDLVLVDGCINDVNARRFLNAGNTPEAIKALAEEKCGAPVEELLARIASTFPNAHIIVSGYYPVFSDKTPRDFFMRALAKRFYAALIPNGPKINSREMLSQLTIISAAWYAASNSTLSDAVARTNARLAARGTRQRVMFAKVAFEPEHAFSARKSQLWGFDASFLRKLLVLVTLGKVDLRTNDEVSSVRSTVCRDFYKRTPGESDNEKRARKDRLMVCRLAAIAHPNRKGAVLYAEAIKEQLQNLLRNPGWLRAPAVGANSP